MTRSIFVLGATGGTGGHVLTAALDAGHRVTALVRDPARLKHAHPRLTVVKGDALDPEGLARALAGHDAVICALGAAPSDRTHLRERGTASLVQAMARAGVRRLVVMSSHGVGDSAPELPWWMRWVVVPLYLKRVFADHDAQERVVRDSQLEWTLLRPGWLTDGEAKGSVGPVDARHLQITRADVARELVRCADDPTTVRATIPLANR